MKWITAASEPPRGRLIGVIYLLYFLMAVFAQVLGQHKLSAISNVANVMAFVLYLILTFLFFFPTISLTDSILIFDSQETILKFKMKRNI